MHKALSGNAPRYLQEIFTLRVTAYKLRNFENKLFLPKPRTDYLNALLATVEQCRRIVRHLSFVQRYL